MTHWIIYCEDFSEGFQVIDIVCYKDHEEAVKFFESLENNENRWFHLTEDNDIRTNKKAA